MNQSLKSIQQRIGEVEVKLQEMEQLNVRMTDQMRELYLLYEITRQLCTCRSSKDIYQTLTRIFRYQFYIEEFAVMVYRPKSGIIEIDFSRNLPKRHLKANFFKPGIGIAGRAFVSGKPVYIPNIQRVKGFKYFNIKPDVTGCLLYIPLVLPNSEKFGLIKLRKPVPNSFKELEKKVLATLGNELAVSCKNAQQYDSINSKTWLDSVTGLHNRKYFESLFKIEFKRSQRYQHALSIIFLEIQGLPQLPQQFKKADYDQILKITADSMIGGIRGYDGCFHYGEGKFVVLLPETEKGPAKDVALKIERIIHRGIEDMFPGYMSQISCKLGVATYPTDTIEPPDLLTIAQSNIFQNEAGKIIQQK